MKKDEVFEQSRKSHLITVGFLTALKENLDPKTAFKIASDGFNNFMKEYYTLVLKETTEGSQERFDRFRHYYGEYAHKSTYIKVVESGKNILKVRFNRCPFAEVMTEYNLSYFSYAFCLSDYAFSEKVLPGVKFQRTHEIARGDQYCDHTWTYHKI